MQLVTASVACPDASLSTVYLPVERLTLAKRIWRAQAEDGMDFGFELGAPLKDGDTFWQAEARRYVVRQAPEPVLEISLAFPPSAAAAIGWAIGNLHLELSSETERLLAPDDSAVRRLLERLDVSYTPTTAVFRPGRFARGDRKSQDLGPSHRH